MQAFTFEFYVLSLLVISKYQTAATGSDAGKLSDSVTQEQTTQQNEATEKPHTADKLEFKRKISPLEHYKKLFTEHRATQLNAVKSMQKFGNQEAQFKLVNIMLNQLFKNLYDASMNLTMWGYMPGDEFPQNETIRENETERGKLQDVVCLTHSTPGVSKVLENTALFGDMLLRMPVAVHEFYDKNREWQLLMAWAYSFSNQSGVFDGPHEMMLNLMGQEANLIPKSPNYVNPFLAGEEEARAKVPVDVVPKKPKEKKIKKIPRGPRMSRTEL